MRLLAAVAAFVSAAAAIDCSAKELAAYNFQSIKGTYTVETIKDTPPTKTRFKWLVGVCQILDEEEVCPKNSDVCGTTWIQVDGKDVLAELIGFNANLQKTYTAFDDEGKDKESGVKVHYKDVNWGENLVDGTIRFVCTNAKDADKNKLRFVKWDGSLFEAEMRTPAACASGSGKKPAPEHGDDDTGERWGWFTWIFIFMVLFLSIYIIGGAWFQYNKGNSIDFQLALKEVLENFVDLLRGLPAFFREIVEKVTGNSNRGEYSAV